MKINQFQHIHLNIELYNIIFIIYRLKGKVFHIIQMIHIKQIYQEKIN